MAHSLWWLGCRASKLTWSNLFLLLARSSLASQAFFLRWRNTSTGKQPALRMPKWGMWYIVWGEGVFCRSLPFPRQRLHVPCLFPNLALPRVDSPSGLASQTWPCHILGSHKGWFLRNRCLPHVDVLKGGFFHSSSCHACLGQASVSLGAPRMPTNVLHHGPQNRIQKTSRNMAARKGPRLYTPSVWAMPIMPAISRGETI